MLASPARTLDDVPLQPNEREMLTRLMAAIRERFGDLLIEARLFGSKARGDSDPESDIDVWLPFERELTKEERRELTRTVVDFELAHDVVGQTVVDARWRWATLACKGGGLTCERMVGKWRYDRRRVGASEQAGSDSNA